MKKYIEPQKEIPVSYETDVCVIGSGPAGFAAAYSAAKRGASVILIEQLGDIGGMSTSGLMSHWVGNVNCSVYSEIMRRTAQMNEGEHKGKITIYIDAEKLKTLYLQMLEEVNCKILFYTLACDVIKEGNELKGVIIESKSGREAIMAKCIIDASGDGDIAAKSGAEYFTGRESDGKMQPATLMFKVGGVDTDRAVYLGSFESTYVTEKGELQELAKKHLKHPAGHVLTYHTTLPGVVACNMTNSINVDGTKGADLTKALIECRSQIDSIVKFLREYVPGYEKCFVISSASLIGIRETRHFKGMYTITEDDVLAARQFDDWVVRDALFNFDVHNIEGSGLDKTGVQKKFKQTKGYTIPYGCLVPKEIDNLLLAGRNISGTHMAHSNYRAMPICAGIGEAAGTAAAIAAKQGIKARDVNVKEIQDILIENGMVV